jgi:hypothetical protein
MLVRPVFTQITLLNFGTVYPVYHKRTFFSNFRRVCPVYAQTNSFLQILGQCVLCYTLTNALLPHAPIGRTGETVGAGIHRMGPLSVKT